MLGVVLEESGLLGGFGRPIIFGPLVGACQPLDLLGEVIHRAVAVLNGLNVVYEVVVMCRRGITGASEVTLPSLQSEV